MNIRQRKWVILAVAGSTSGIAMLLLFRSFLLAAGTATVIVVGVVIIKHVALAMIVGSPLAALFQRLKPTIRAHCPFAKS